MGYNVSMIDGHIDKPRYLYIVYDADGASEAPVYGVFTSRRRAFEAIDEIALRCVEDMLANDPKETGVTEEDRDWLIKDTKNSFAVQVLSNVNVIEYNSDIRRPLV